jgi:protein PET117
MYQGVLRDDERRREKMRQRQNDLLQSQRKREIYERAQTVNSEGDSREERA